MSNVPAYATGRFSFGPGIVYIGPVGSTPTIDIGAVKGDMEFNIERTKLEIKQGSPQSLVEEYAIEEKVMLKGTSIEWNTKNLAYFIGAGVTGASGPEETYEFGGDMAVASYAVRLVHLQPDGSTIDIHLFDADGSGSMAIALKETDVHEMPFEFMCKEASLDFKGAVPAANKKKVKIIRTAA